MEIVLHILKSLHSSNHLFGPILSIRQFSVMPVTVATISSLISSLSTNPYNFFFSPLNATDIELITYMYFATN